VWAELKYGDPNAALRTYLRGQVDAALDRAGIGGISELHDLSGTRGPEFQAWSMAGFLEALHAFAGVRIDVPERRIVVAPQRPDSWPHLRARKWYGAVPFDLAYGGNAVERSLSIEFPWRVPEDVSVEVQIILPRGRAVEAVELTVGGAQGEPTWRLERLPGTSQDRVCLTVPASGTLSLTVRLRAASVRVARIA
jgi:hypothetical protein